MFHWRDQIKNVEKKWEFFIFVTSSDQSFVLYLSKLLCTKYEVKWSILAIQPLIQTIPLQNTGVGIAYSKGRLLYLRNEDTVNALC